MRAEGPEGVFGMPVRPNLVVGGGADLSGLISVLRVEDSKFGGCWNRRGSTCCGC